MPLQSKSSLLNLYLMRWSSRQAVDTPWSVDIAIPWRKPTDRQSDAQPSSMKTRAFGRNQPVPSWGAFSFVRVFRSSKACPRVLCDEIEHPGLWLRNLREKPNQSTIRWQLFRDAITGIPKKPTKLHPWRKKKFFFPSRKKKTKEKKN